MFDAQNPARNISELVSYLRTTSGKRHCFRGQTRWYPRNAPSGIRPALKDGPASGVWLPVDPQYNLRAKPRDRARYDLRAGVLQACGRVVGTLLCQQYGITSDAFDLTSDPVIAAFFATRKYPAYSHYVPDRDGECGVIYRINVGRPPATIADVEKTMTTMYTRLQGRTYLWFEQAYLLGHAILNGKFKSQAEIDEQLRTWFPNGHQPMPLFRQAMYLPHHVIRQCYLTKARELGFTGDLELQFDATRTAAQKGGIYYPCYRHVGVAATDLQARVIDAENCNADPSACASFQLDAVIEFNGNQNVETFYFRHSEDQVEIEDLSLLWPDAEHDMLFHILVEVAKSTCAKYLADFSTEPTDQNLGLIDRGFYPAPA